MTTAARRSSVEQRSDLAFNLVVVCALVDPSRTSFIGGGEKCKADRKHIQRREPECGYQAENQEDDDAQGQVAGVSVLDRWAEYEGAGCPSQDERKDRCDDCKGQQARSRVQTHWRVEFGGREDELHLLAEAGAGRQAVGRDDAPVLSERCEHLYRSKSLPHEDDLKRQKGNTDQRENDSRAS